MDVLLGAEARQQVVSMKSGLEGRNNLFRDAGAHGPVCGVSMKSGLEGRNNRPLPRMHGRPTRRLNEVRPRRPEQSGQSASRSTRVSTSQ